MTTFILSGRIISKDELPLKDLRITAYDYEPLLNPNDLLGEVTTDAEGYFRIAFDESKFSGFLRHLLGTPGMRLVVNDRQGNEILETKITHITKETEYHIRVVDDAPDKNAIDIYSGNARRMISMLSEVGSMLGMENKINVDVLNNTKLPEDTKQKLQGFVNTYDERRNNFSQFVAILSDHLADTFLEKLHIDNIGYDGPQVPREPRRESYKEVVTWPRKEKFKWA